MKPLVQLGWVSSCLKLSVSFPRTANTLFMNLHQYLVTGWSPLHFAHGHLYSLSSCSKEMDTISLLHLFCSLDKVDRNLNSAWIPMLSQSKLEDCTTSVQLMITWSFLTSLYAWTLAREANVLNSKTRSKVDGKYVQHHPQDSSVFLYLKMIKR